MMNAPAWQSQRSVPAARTYSSDHFPLDSASPTGAGNGKWMQQVEYSRMLRSMQKGSSGDFVVPSETSATPTRLSSQRNVDLDELSPGIHDLHSFDTELLPEVGICYEEAYAALNAAPLNQHFDRTRISHVQLLCLTEELSKVDEKLKLTKNLLETKNLEIKKINDEKKASMVVQFVAEATLRRVHAAQKDDDMPPIEAIFAPLEAELKLARQEIAKLQDDNRALDRLTKSKEAVLLDAERTVEFDLAKASMVDDLQNKNQELMKQIEICQEENMIPDKMHRQKVAEVEKLSQTVCELEEAVLAVVLPLM